MSGKRIITFRFREFIFLFVLFFTSNKSDPHSPIVCAILKKIYYFLEWNLIEFNATWCATFLSSFIHLNFFVVLLIFSLQWRARLVCMLPSRNFRLLQPKNHFLSLSLFRLLSIDCFDRLRAVQSHSLCPFTFV